jgi:FKBP-type peptidyl-prolyl cis-trans isomerase FkpA
VFDVDMIDFIPEAVLQQMQMQQMMQGGGAGAPPRGQALPPGAR